ncbi:MAG: DNA primase [Deltaproteobacteria bacterium]|nr:DNA primase [Deltaproteobacteria bacterium]
MARIPEDTIQQVRDRVDIVDVVGRVVSLKKAGRNFKGLCPFHEEKTPSFNVSPDRGSYHCFGCGEGGNAFGFLMKHEGLAFPEAVRSLAVEVGVEIKEEAGGGAPSVTEPVLAANLAAQALYRRALMGEDGAVARAYLAKRGLDAEIAERFGIGYAPDRWDAVVTVLQHEDIPAEIGEAAGLLKARERGGHYDMLRGRISFPIQDTRGRVIGFGGRAIGKDQEPKYLNSPESPVFHKRRAFYGFPFALDPIRKKDRVVVVEGYFDWVALARAGVEEAVATCGTALTEQHTRDLRRRTRNVVLLFDGDDAGQRAMLRALETLLPQGLRVSAAGLPAGQDPDDLLQNEGAEALVKRIDEAPPALNVAIARAVAEGVSTPWERADAAEAVVPLLALVPDPVERAEFTRQLAMATGVEPREIEAATRKLQTGEGTGEVVLQAGQRVRGPEHRHFELALQVLLNHPGLLAQAEDLVECAPDPALGELAREIASGASVDVLLDRVEGEPKQILSKLAAEGLGDLEGEALAARALADALSRLHALREKREREQLNRRLADDATLLAEKNAELLNRRQRQSAV